MSFTHPFYMRVEKKPIIFLTCPMTVAGGCKPWRCTRGRVCEGRGCLLWDQLRWLENTLLAVFTSSSSEAFTTSHWSANSLVTALALPAQSKHHTCIPQVPDDKTRLSFAHQKLRLPQPRYLHIPDTLGLAAAVQLVFGVFCFRTALICSTWQVQS